MAQSPILRLDGPVAEDVTIGHIEYLIDPEWSLTVDEMAVPDTQGFEQLEGKKAVFGFTQSKIWFRLQVSNETPDTEWRLYFAENFKQIFDVWLVRSDGSISSLVSLERDSSFSERPVAYPELVAPFELAQGETATILVSLWSEGSAYLKFVFHTAESFSELAAKRTARNFIFYGMMLLLIGAALLSLLIFRHRVFLAYCAYATSALLYVMHVDGVAFQYLWPNAPLWNSNASVYTGLGIIVFGAVYARVFLKTSRRHPIMDKVLLAVIGVALLEFAVLIWWHPQLLKKVLVLTCLVAMIIVAVSACVAARHRFMEVRFYLLAWIGVLFSVILMNLNHIFGVAIDQDFLYDSMRAVMVFDAFMMGLAIADRYNQLRQSRHLALQDSLDRARRNIHLNQRLADLEAQYAAMQVLARTRTEQVQETVHDLRQPLHALRINVRNLADGRDEDMQQSDVEGLDKTFAYLERLISENLATVSDDAEPAPGVTRSEEQMKDPLSLHELLTGVHEMFIEDAADKKLKFFYEPTVEPRDVALEPLKLMRILINLVGNAIKYTETGSVWLRTRVDGEGSFSIEVEDTGSGLSAAQFEEALVREVRLDGADVHAEGSGLGLTIAHRLAEEQGHALRRLPPTGGGAGTRIAVVFPAAGESKERVVPLRSYAS